MATKIITQAELLEHTKKDSLYVLLHNKGQSQYHDVSFFIRSFPFVALQSTMSPSSSTRYGYHMRQYATELAHIANQQHPGGDEVILAEAGGYRRTSA